MGILGRMSYETGSINFMKFDVVNPNGHISHAYERNIKLLDDNTIDIRHVEETIEMILDTLDIEYETMTNPVFDKLRKYWITHRLLGDYEGCVVRLFSGKRI